MANESITEFVLTMGSAEENVLAHRKAFVVKNLMQVMNAVLNVVHIFNCGSNGRKTVRDW